MDTPSQCTVDGGRRNNPRASQYSKNTQDLLRSMMQETTLTHSQRKHINECLKNGSALPLSTQPSPSRSTSQPKGSRCVHKLLPGRPQRRSAASCRSGNNYVREKFSSAPTMSSFSCGFMQETWKRRRGGYKTSWQQDGKKQPMIQMLLRVRNLKPQRNWTVTRKFWMRLRKEDNSWLTWPLWDRRRSTST
ncbi:UPF0193 protein EVG1 isoform X2 [Nerophis lumbriciformis]|uniref:UPF0193 protein EVG1 isoform X2 n=1 Tax=Nerophis lumbriciformis TaxID=546530 RepID=UPI002AE00799|nr:uncharacterized protein LOC133624567 isoform X2 [Nerophis lumbriciformis]